MRGLGDAGLGRRAQGFLCSALPYDRRSQGARGRALRAALPPLGLEAGDRLEPCAALRNVADLDILAAFPARILLWRPRSETIALHSWARAP